MSDGLADTLIRPRVTAKIGDRASVHHGTGTPVPLLNREAWRDALLAWIGQVALVFAVIYIGRTLLLTQQRFPTAATTSWGKLFSDWLGWDSGNYAKIAVHGYAQLWMAAYSPGLPALERVVITLTGLQAEAAGALISLVTTFITFGLFRVLAEREIGHDAAQRALLYVAVFPTAFFFLTAYPESLVLAFTCGAFLAMRQGRWIISGLLIALATLTHLTGILLVIPLILEIVGRWRRARVPFAVGDWARAAAGIALGPAALGAFDFYLYRRFGTFFAMSRAEEKVWGKGLSVPLLGFARAGGALIRGGFNPGAEQVHIVLDGVFTLALIGMAVAVWRDLPRAYGIYMAAFTLVLVSTPLHNWYALMSNPRYVLEAVPMFFLFGRWGGKPWLDRLMLILSLPLLVLFILIFAMGGWVA